MSLMSLPCPLSSTLASKRKLESQDKATDAVKPNSKIFMVDKLSRYFNGSSSALTCLKHIYVSLYCLKQHKNKHYQIYLLWSLDRVRHTKLIARLSYFKVGHVYIATRACDYCRYIYLVVPIRCYRAPKKLWGQVKWFSWSAKLFQFLSEAAAGQQPF